MKETNDQIDELKNLIARVARYQGRESDSKFCQRYGKYIGTSRTWRGRLLAGDFQSIKIEERVNLLREFVACLEGGEVTSEFYPELKFNQAFQAGVEKLESMVATDRRIFCVLGGVGVGKTVSCKAAYRKSIEPGYVGPKRLLITIPEALRESKVGLLTEIADKLGCASEQSGAAAQMRAIVTHLSGAEVTILVDEGHQGGVMLMRLIKDLVNLTRARFVYVALRTEWARVISSSSGSMIEAKQFVRRCILPIFDIYAGGTKNAHLKKPADAVQFIVKKTGLAADDAGRVAANTIQILNQNGNLSTLCDAVDLALAAAEDKGTALTADALEDTIKEMCQ